MQHSKGDCSLIQTLIKMVKQEGILSPFKGLLLPLTFTALQTAVIFQTYGYAYRFLRPESALDKDPSRSATSSSSAVSSRERGCTPWRGVWEAAAAGSFAGSVQVALWSPIEMIKLQSQLQTAKRGDPSYNGPWKIARGILQTQGMPGLYRGVTVTLFRDLPSFGVYFAIYRLLAQSIEPNVAEPSEAGPSTQIVAGGLAGCCAWMSIYPLDVIKARMQGARDHDRSRTWMHYARGIQRESGTGGFFRGLGPTLTRAFVMDSVAFLSLTTVLKLIH